MTLHNQDFPGFRVGDLVTGTVQHFDGAAAEVRLGTIEALLPRAEQIPGETFRASQPIRAVILNMPELGQRSRMILSRTHPDLLRRLFETEVPEIADQRVTIQVLAREAGYRSRAPHGCIAYAARSPNHPAISSGVTSCKAEQNAA